MVYNWRASRSGFVSRVYGPEDRALMTSAGLSFVAVVAGYAIQPANKAQYARSRKPKPYSLMICEILYYILETIWFAQLL